MLETARNAVNELPGKYLHRVRTDRGDQTERQILALEAIASSLSQGAAQPEASCRVMTYDEAAVVLKISPDLLGKMVADGRLRQGRHFIRIGTNVRFVSNLVVLIFEDQLSLEDATSTQTVADALSEESTSSAIAQVQKDSFQIKLPKNQNPSRTASKNRAGLDIDRARRAS